MRSNLILRLPKDIETVLNLEKGVDVTITLEKDGFKVEPLPAVMAIAARNEMFAYAYKYMKKKYGRK